VTHCGSCGEPAAGQYCRMCGARLASGPTATTALIPATARGDFDALFRPEGGEAAERTRLLSATRTPPRAGQGPPAAAPAAPGGRHSGAGGPEGPQEPGNRKAMVYGTLGAVAIVAAVILLLLYLGNRSTAVPSASGSAQATPSATAPATINQVVLPSNAPAPTTAPPTPTTPAKTTGTGGTAFPLSQGSTGRNVVWLQQRLKQLGYYHGPVQGTFDQATAQAVVDFQSRAHVTGDPAGVVGASTVTALDAAGATPDLKPGSHSGTDVRRLQEALNSAENAGLAVSGRYDAQTVAAVARYQQAVGLPATGDMNGQTWQALQSGRLAN
jgi:peptidoglycan hydrolase-like protein with peptidoglycan-binding domain